MNSLLGIESTDPFTKLKSVAQLIVDDEEVNDQKLYSHTKIMTSDLMSQQLVEDAIKESSSNKDKFDLFIVALQVIVKKVRHHFDALLRPMDPATKLRCRRLWGVLPPDPLHTCARLCNPFVWPPRRARGKSCKSGLRSGCQVRPPYSNACAIPLPRWTAAARAYCRLSSGI